jgi:hypothetical protein
MYNIEATGIDKSIRFSKKLKTNENYSKSIS